VAVNNYIHIYYNREPTHESLDYILTSYWYLSSLQYFCWQVFASRLICTAFAVNDL